MKTKERIKSLEQRVLKLERTLNEVGDIHKLIKGIGTCSQPVHPSSISNDETPPYPLDLEMVFSK